MIFLHVQLGFSVNVFGGNVDIFVLLCYADDEVSYIVGEGFFLARGTDNLIFCLKLAGLWVRYFSVSMVMILEAQAKHGWC